MIGYQYTIKVTQMNEVIMYLNHYGLKQKPFNISPDPHFLWLGVRHKEALATLRYGIQEDKGFLLLTGDVGTGKTVLINRLIKLLDVKVIVATIPDPNLGLIDFYNILADELKMGRTFTQKGEFLIHFKKFLMEAHNQQKNVLLIIDEAQRLEHGLLDEIRVLSNTDLYGSKLINIFLVGQSELREMLLEERNRPFRQRISVNYNIEPLTEKETASFIEHRLKVAGATRRYFTADAIREVFLFSKGFPRLINVICDHALMSGYSAGITMITGGVVKECAYELQITENAIALPLKEEAPVTDRAPTQPQASVQQQKIDEDIEEAEIASKVSFIRVAGFVVIGLFFIGFIISFFRTSSPEHSPELAKLDTQTAIDQSLAEEETEQRTNLADFEKDSRKLPAIAPKSENIKVEEYTEERDLDQKQAEKELKEVGTDPAAQDETTEKNFEKGYIEDSHATINEEKSTVFQTALQGSNTQAKQSQIVDPVKKIIIYFKRDSTEIDIQQLNTLADIAFYLSRNKNISIIVEGYTDSYGDYVYNRNLSQLRANTVKSYLVGRGASTSQISAIGLGPQNPIGDNANREGRSKNRRVEIKFKPETKGDAEY
ncbi:MAG: AAA family ATPase [Desulfobacterales bacterium]|nr:MAG: AAA family ATPase [Desulfobacterales bacterium]